jgi:hypothetical protein
MIHTSRPKLLAKPISRSETEIGDSNSHATVEAQDILWLEVAVVYAKRMTVLDGIKEL